MWHVIHMTSYDVVVNKFLLGSQMIASLTKLFIMYKWGYNRRKKWKI
jgi:hypothetical protein